MHATALNYYVERSGYESFAGDVSESDASPGCHSPASSRAGTPPTSATHQRQAKKFRCTWKGCGLVELTQAKIEKHVRDKHLGKKARRSGDYDSCSEHEEEFYYTEDEYDDELVKTPSPASPPTLSHRDMARPPHEDPEYQRQIVGNFQQGRTMNNYNHLPHQQTQVLNRSNSSHITTTQQQQLHNNNTSCIPTSPLAHHNYTWVSNAGIAVSPSLTSSHQPHQSNSNSSSATLNKHARPSSSRPSHSTAPYPSPTYVHHHHHNYSNSSVGSAASGSNSSNSSNSSSCNSSPVIHSNSSANNMLQQLSQQNVTVTAHHNQNSSSGGQPQQHQQQHHLSSVTITPNYHPPQQQQHQQQHLRGQQQTTATNNMVANSGQHMPLQHVAVQQTVTAAKHTPNSPNRRTRGENKKCRKVYGMERREQWCTQCRWKKACSRFGD